MIQATITWVDNSNNEANFELERKVGAGAYVLLATLAADTTSYLDTGLTPGETYSYRVRAVNAYGASAYAPEVSGTAPTAPAAPSNMTLVISVTP